MRRVKRLFSDNVSCEITPELSQIRRRRRQECFALFLCTGETLSVQDIINIQNRTGLSPLFFALARNEKLDVSRSYARSLCAQVFRPQTKYDAIRAMKACNFSISEELLGVVLSFLSHTPAYVNAGCAECRKFIGEISCLDYQDFILIPYTKNKTAHISRIQPR